MLVKTALLIVSNPKKIGKILPLVSGKVKNTLYIQLLSALNDSLSNFFTTWPKYSQTIYGIYSQAAAHCRGLDVRVLLSNLKYNDVHKVQTCHKIDLVIFDRSHNENDIKNFITERLRNVGNCEILTFDSGTFENLDQPTVDDKVYDHSVLGGTFDRLHLAHKLLLSEAILRSKDLVTIGLTTEKMLQSKLLWELIEDYNIRKDNMLEFLTDVCPELRYNVTQIDDPFGPSITDPTMELIVVSEETIRGAEKINEIRKSAGLKKLEVTPVRLLDEPNPKHNEEPKISSSNTRIRLLGTILHPIKTKDYLPKRPYVLGLTGGVASGKSGVAKWLSLKEVDVINCDLIGHDVYKPGKPCYHQLVKHFGNNILTSEGEINRRELGNIVFNDVGKRKELNNLVWPFIKEEVKSIIRSSKSDVIVVEAAILFEAEWDQFCHEVWTTLLPREEAVKRLKSRNNMSEEKANAIIDSQLPSAEYVRNSNVVFCTLWAEEYTKEQVDKAWNLLKKRL